MAKTSRKLGSFLNIEIAKGYARIAKHPLLIGVQNGVINNWSFEKLSNNWKQSEIYIDEFHRNYPNEEIFLVELNDKSNS